MVFFNYFLKNSILDVWQDSEYVYVEGFKEVALAFFGTLQVVRKIFGPKIFVILGFEMKGYVKSRLQLYRNHPINLQFKSMDLFLYDGNNSF